LAKKNRISDLDYCYAAWLLLTELEKLAYDRNQAIRDFQARSAKKQSMISTGLALFLPVVLWLYLLLFSGQAAGFLGSGISFETNGTRLIGLFTITIFLFLIVNVVSRNLWTKSVFRPLKKLTERKDKIRLRAEVGVINDKVRHHVNSRAFEESGIPENFLSAEIVALLIRYFESRQASTMKEAVYSLKLDFQNTSKHANLLMNESLLKKEKIYLSDEDGNLEKRILEGEKG
jgi:hypothetical protein